MPQQHGSQGVKVKENEKTVKKKDQGSDKKEQGSRRQKDGDSCLVYNLEDCSYDGRKKSE